MENCMDAFVAHYCNRLKDEASLIQWDKDPRLWFVIYDGEAMVCNPTTVWKGEYNNLRGNHYVDNMVGKVNIPKQIIYDGQTYPVRYIHDSAFMECENLWQLTMPSTIISLGAYAFQNCTNLKMVKLSEALESIEMYTFNGCNSLTAIKMPKKMRMIKESAFSECEKLATIRCNDKLEGIGEYAFYRCKSLNRVLLPYHLKVIRNSAFSECVSLKHIQIKGDVILGHSIFENCGSLQTVVLGKRIKTLPMKIFSNCTRLTTITMPEGLREIGAYAFKNCSHLKRFVIPDNVLNIGCGVLWGCDVEVSSTSKYYTLHEGVLFDEKLNLPIYDHQNPYQPIVDNRH